MPVVVPRVMGAVPGGAVTARLMPAAERSGATLRAPFAPMDLHAGLDLGAVGDECPAQPHGVWRASLLNVRGLGPGHAGRTDKNEDRQRQPIHKTHTAHELFLLRLHVPAPS